MAVTMSDISKLRKLTGLLKLGAKNGLNLLKRWKKPTAIWMPL